MEILRGVLRICWNKLSGLPRHLQTNYLKLVLGKCGKNIRINGRVVIPFPENVEIGDNVSINDGVFISGMEKIVIEDYVRISPHVCIISHGLDLNKHYSEREHISAPVIIRKGAWLGTGCIVLKGVTIGEGAVIGAGAVVTRDVDKFTTVIGVPAKPKIKKGE